MIIILLITFALIIAPSWLAPLQKTSNSRYLLPKELISVLDRWEREELRDFVRGRGTPILERIPIESIERSDESLLDFNMLPQGGMVAVVQPNISQVDFNPHPSLSLSTAKRVEQKTQQLLGRDRASDVRTSIRPASKRRHEEKNSPKNLMSEYRQLANMIQMFIERRSNRLRSSLPHSRPHAPPSSSSPPPLPSVITALPEDGDEFIFGSDWQSMEIEGAEQSLKSGGKGEESFALRAYENKMKELSSQLNQVIQQMNGGNAVGSGSARGGQGTEAVKRDGHNKMSKVTVIRNGSAEQTKDSAYKFLATVTLIEDDGKRILVDTGLGTDINGRRIILEGLLAQGITPPAIDIVITTHGDPDHSVHYSSFYIHHKTRFNLSSLFDKEWHTLTRNVALLRASGHTSNDIAVFVDNEQRMGRVVVSGDIYMREEDQNHPMMWVPLAVDEQLQREARRVIACWADWILPGHGRPFRVGNKRKSSLLCTPNSGNF